MAAGFDHYFVKPVEPAVLFDLLARRGALGDGRAPGLAALRAFAGLGHARGET